MLQAPRNSFERKIPLDRNAKNEYSVFCSAGRLFERISEALRSPAVKKKNHFCAVPVPVGDFRKGVCRGFVNAVFSEGEEDPAQANKGIWNAVLLYGNFTGKSSGDPE